MARKTFISYKFSEAQELRDNIIEAMGDDATYYQGETSESPDLGDKSTENIKKVLSDMMYNTSVTIVIISPNMKKSKWIDWEIEYCLRLEKRKDRISRRNGIVGVIQKVNGSYDWFKKSRQKPDGCSVSIYEEDKVYDIIKNNRRNQDPQEYCCDECKSISPLTGSYISYVEEDEFLNNYDLYIENAYSKSENDAKGYIIKPTR
ncbi:MAG: TIR domain-containing protein [Bacteroidaceae bacterium]|nr:TIR domain-containing protein [Bacteroidaceae bacterium]